MTEFKKIPFEQNTLKELSNAEIASAKAQFGDIYMIQVEGKKVFIHKPTRNVIDLAQISGRSKPSMFEETILRNCWLAGDKEILDDVELFYSISDQIGKIVQTKSAELVKL